MHVDRLAWIDIAKGFCILFVVLGHSVDWYMRNFTQDQPIFWYHVSVAFRPLRMPLFFAISGMLAQRRIDRPLIENWGKTAGLYILYCIWTALFLVKLALPGGRNGLPYPGWDQVALAFLFPVTLWYIWALPFYYLLSHALRRMLGSRSNLAVAPMILLAASAPFIDVHSATIVHPPFDPAHFGALAFNLLWFYLGLQYRDLWITVVRNSTPRATAILCLLCAACWLLNMPEEFAILLTPLVLWTAMGVFRQISPRSLSARICSLFGRETLPIYVMHVFLLTFLTALVRLSGFQRMMAEGSDLLAFVIPPLFMVAIAMICLIAGRLFGRLPILWVLVKPVPSPVRTAAKSLPALQSG